jgi:hypothetical protein
MDGQEVVGRLNARALLTSNSVECLVSGADVNQPAQSLFAAFQFPVPSSWFLEAGDWQLVYNDFL